MLRREARHLGVLGLRQLGVLRREARHLSLLGLGQPGVLRYEALHLGLLGAGSSRPNLLNTPQARPHEGVGDFPQRGLVNQKRRERIAQLRLVLLPRAVVPRLRGAVR